MPETTTCYKPDRPVGCRRCGNLVKLRNIQRHFRGDCESLPGLSVEQKVCSICQVIRLITDFSIRSGTRGGRDNTCRFCNIAACAKARQLNPKPAFVPINRRPGNWVLKPCPNECGKSLNRRSMIRHKPRCPNKPAGSQGPRVNHPDPPDMSDLYAGAQIAGIRKYKEWNLRRKYDIGVTDYERMMTAQNNRCAICGKPPAMTNRANKSLHVDHDHTTGTIRALLCTQCNHLIGNCMESTGILISAIGYLAKHQPVKCVS